MRIAVGIATAGRREILSETLRQIGQLSRLPDRLIVCPAGPDDCDSSISLPVRLELVASRRGLTTQRNAILDAVSDIDVLVFFDDDFFPATDYLSLLEAEILALPGVAMVTGTLLADDILGRGLSPQQAIAILSEQAGKPPATGHMADVYNGYGCNMAVSMSKVRSSGARFDEALPLYGWLEDVDFSRTLVQSGEIRKSPALRGVHLGAKAGRTSGLRFGYSQIANPIYLWRKGTLTLARALRQIGKNILANSVKVFRPEPWVDRSGRLRGNALAILDMFAGRMAPGRILELSPKPPAPGRDAA
jgi:glycosyltransferase involved in cell wall biosynthesis